VLKETISRGVSGGLLAYVGKTTSGAYKPFSFNQTLLTTDVEFSDDMFIVTKETADAYLKISSTSTLTSTEPPSGPPTQSVPPTEPPTAPPPGKTKQASETIGSLTWTGDVPPQKWMNFYTKILSKFASGRGLKLTVKVEATPDGGFSKQKLEETKSALRELGLTDDIDSH
jgi:hypothetical protein